MTIDGVEYVTVDRLMQQLTLARRWAERQVPGERARCAEIAREVRMHARHASEVNRAATWIEETIRKGA